MLSLAFEGKNYSPLPLVMKKKFFSFLSRSFSHITPLPNSGAEGRVNAAASPPAGWPPPGRLRSAPPLVVPG